MSIVRPFLPHPLHLRAAWLKVPEILLPQPGLFIHLYRVPWKWTRGGLVCGQCLEDALGGFPRAAVGGCEEVEGVVCS